MSSSYLPSTAARAARRRVVVRRRRITLLLTILAAAGIVAYLIGHPDRIPLLAARGQVRPLDDRIYLGPYLAAEEMTILQSLRVGLVISVMNPAFPPEAILLKQEAAALTSLGIRLVNVPMSFLDLRSEENLAAALRAAEIAAAFPGRVYIHCYRGIDRVRVVAEMLGGGSR